MDIMCSLVDDAVLASKFVSNTSNPEPNAMKLFFDPAVVTKGQG